MMSIKKHRSSPVVVGVVSMGVGAALVLLQGAVLTDGTTNGSEHHDEPAKVVPVAGSDVSTVALTEEAAERIDLQTEQVQPRRGEGRVVPYAALLYDAEGDTWVYARTASLSFMRSPVQVDTITGERVQVTGGPRPGTDVVTVGAAELWGAEFGVGH